MPDKKETDIDSLSMPKLNTLKKLQIIIGSILAIMTVGITIAVINPSTFLIAAILFFTSYGMIILLFIKLLTVEKL